MDIAQWHVNCVYDGCASWDAGVTFNNEGETKDYIENQNSKPGNDKISFIPYRI